MRPRPIALNDVPHLLLVVSSGPVLLPNLFCLQRKARAGPARVWTNFSLSSNSTMCWSCHICCCFNLSTLRGPNPAGFAQPIFPDSTGMPSKSQHWRAPSARTGSLLAASRLARSQSMGEERQRDCLHPSQLMGGKRAGRDWVGNARAQILNYHLWSGWISAGWMAIYC